MRAILIIGVLIMPWHDDMRAVSAAIAQQQRRDRPLLVDPEYNYLPGRSAPRPEWDHYWQLESAKTGARVSPDLFGMGPLPMPAWYERPLIRRGLQMLPPVTMPEGTPEQDEAPAPNGRGLINRPKRNPWD